MYFHYFIFFSLCFRSLPLPSATCDRQAGGESSPIRLVPILCWVEFPPHPFGRSSASQSAVSRASQFCPVCVVYSLEPQFQLDSVDDLNLLGGLPVLVFSACCYVIGKSSLRRDPLYPPCATPHPHPHPHPYTHAHSHTHGSAVRPPSPFTVGSLPTDL